MSRYGYTHSLVLLDSASANSSTRTSNPLLVADATTISASWTTNTASASSLTIQGSNEDGASGPIGLWSTVSVVAAAGIFTVTPGARWLRFIRPAVDSQGSVVVDYRST
ncbi:MAG TPA: hypothetical protein VK647_05510 [Gemmatimonadales bacterium]|jgi:hypothetical protein|nr:hypothetical protein [Gemmatimonadales bacterium]